MTEEDLNRLKLKIEETMSFPGVYMFKLIVPSENRSIALVENIFEAETDILTKESDKGKYTSITAKQVVMSSEEIIAVYRKAALIKGVIFL
jgi:putative lipoic acid-binding regulatory protein